MIRQVLTGAALVLAAGASASAGVSFSLKPIKAEGTNVVIAPNWMTISPNALTTDNERGSGVTFPAVVDYDQPITNVSGLDYSAVIVRIIPFEDETYETPFTDIVFDTGIGFSITGGGLDSTPVLAGNQEVRYNFAAGDTFGVGEQYIFHFTVNSPSEEPYQLEFEFVQVPAPAGAAVIAGAGLMGLRRRRS
ncbi:MAG TPA: hypothetical protein VG797_03875 [Phycisphaerales bacterium]|nr:hypothetical protein [Phycisphaerales bacterium]